MIPDAHHIEKTEQRGVGFGWQCVNGCANDAKWGTEEAAADDGERHVRERVDSALRTLAPSLLGDALRAGAQETGGFGLVAAVDLLDRHGYWFRQVTNLAPHIVGYWADNGRFQAWVRWEQLMEAADNGAFHPGGSTTEANMLRIAASLASPYRVSLHDATRSMGPGNLALVREAVRVLLG